MSADNWAVCPRCAVRLGQPIGQYEKATNLERNFREDWEIGVFDGEFFVQYKGVCGECNLRYEFTYERMLDLDGS